MELEISWVSLDDNFRARIDEIKNKINDETMAVVATAGTSSLGAIDPIDRINDLCRDVYFHVDAAFGGFVIPLMDTDIRIDFSLRNVDSMTIDPHKMGLSVIPSGCILFRDKSYLDKLEISPGYLQFGTSTLSGSRSGGAIASVWANIKYLKIDGYRGIVDRCMRNTEFLCNELRYIEGIDLVTEPAINVVAIRSGDTRELSDKLREKGWKLLMDSVTNSIRIVVMPHVTKEVIKKLIDDLKGCL